MLSLAFETESGSGWIMIGFVVLKGDIRFKAFLSKVKKIVSGAVEKISRGIGRLFCNIPCNAAGKQITVDLILADLHFHPPQD